ncbi:MAG TPA: hypothetical protein VMB71_15160, partial [Acetobacteraceae bacterium]|nr:hypothetical protein [Acetobacteraceae bacterium]
YAPLFGYHLERFPFKTIHPGSAFMAFDDRLNFKNPACYVFPGANQCSPGDQFTQSLADALRTFLAYGPLPFNKPLYARAADWIGLLSLCVFPLLLGGSAWCLRRRKPIKLP